MGSIGVMANTTASAIYQVAAPTYKSYVDFFSEFVQVILCPKFLFPQPLFRHVVEINYLCYEAASRVLSASGIAAKELAR
ncbi:uncharacterized protein PV09_05460 [Verruconis gallopava]|uniref:Uncharacterized protein n=1 Tax=Verruconis gallopava TaxID=253628 RepID=A0A0D2A8Z6_9PEZI|nr:uncharacterized protein PV09_05460 [Verruconis gallopava]KIW03238.1 hypothetical protein PV09_05460 [Verruconis gallopava]